MRVANDSSNEEIKLWMRASEWEQVLQISMNKKKTSWDQREYLSISCPVGEFKVSKMRTDLKTFKVYMAVNIYNENINFVSNILLFKIIIHYNTQYCSNVGYHLLPWEMRDESLILGEPVIESINYYEINYNQLACEKTILIACEVLCCAALRRLTSFDSDRWGKSLAALWYKILQKWKLAQKPIYALFAWRPSIQ